MQALASLHVRFKIHDGYDAADEDPRKPSEKLTAEKLEMLDSAVKDPNDELTSAQKDQVRQLLLARRIDAFARPQSEESKSHPFCGSRVAAQSWSGTASACPFSARNRR